MQGALHGFTALKFFLQDVNSQAGRLLPYDPLL